VSVLHLLRVLFGPGTWGAGGNMVAWVICGGLGFAWMHLKAEARHAEALAQAAVHHAERLALAAEHHEALRAHVTATAQARTPRPAAKRLATPAERKDKGAGA